MNAQQNLKLHGLTIASKNMILAGQGFRCAICPATTPGGGPRGQWCIDHCHTTGKLRGLLCHACNLALGHVADNTATLASMIEYINEHGRLHALPAHDAGTAPIVCGQSVDVPAGAQRQELAERVG